MLLHYGSCPHCDALKAVEVELATDRQGAAIWQESFPTVSSDRVSEDDECRCVRTPEEVREGIATAEDNAIHAEPDDRGID